MLRAAILTARTQGRTYGQLVGRLNLHRPDGSLVGSFSERLVALRIAREVLDSEDGPLLLDTFDDAGAKVCEALVSRRAGETDQPAKR